MFTTENAEKILGENNNRIYLASLFPALDPYSTGQLVSALQNISLTHPRNIRLILNDNAIGDEGCAELAKLGNIPNLFVEHIEIAENSIGDSGADAISRLKGLHTLVIADNQITGKGLLNLIQNAKQLTHLNISGNNLGDQDASALLKGLRGIENSALTNLNLGNNDISEALLLEINQWLSENRKKLTQKEPKEKEFKKLMNFFSFLGNPKNEPYIKSMMEAKPEVYTKCYFVMEECQKNMEECQENKIVSPSKPMGFFQAQSSMKSKDASSDPVVETGESKETKDTKLTKTNKQ